MNELRLSCNDIQNSEKWQAAGIELPKFDHAAMRDATIDCPRWVHFGSGNIFRSFIAPLQQKLLDSGKAAVGVIAAEAFDYQIVEKVYRPYDNLSLLVLTSADGGMEKRVIASIADSVLADSDNPAEWNRIATAFRNPSLQMISFTITEKGYALTDLTGALLPSAKADLERGPARPQHVMGKVTALLLERYRAGAVPIAAVSMDNCSRNGEKLQKAVMALAEEWVRRGFADSGFVSYLSDESKVTFPWTMIDKITPRPSQKVAESLNRIGFADTGIIFTDKKTCVAPFVNAEVPQYLVIEDRFPNGRPALEHAGVLFTDRKTVNLTERMKVCTCLNPLHTALAIFGCLLGYDSIAAEMGNANLCALINRIGKTEGMPAVEDPGILSPRAFLDEVVTKRLPNPFIPDTPQRIACDTSLKMPIRYGNTILAYCKRKDLDMSSLVGIPFTIAGWCRYLTGVDDSGKNMELSPDPMIGELQKLIPKAAFGNPDSARAGLKQMLSNADLFGADLYQVGLGGRIEGYFREMAAGPGAVSAALKKYFG